MEIQKTIIIGSGPAGYTAAIYAARAELQPLMIAGGEPGGQLMTTTEVENWPGEPEGIFGADLIEKLKKQAVRFGTKILGDSVVEVDFTSRPFVIKTTSDTFEAESVIIATGASAMWLGIAGEERLKGHGVSACATCDGFFFKEKKVVVIGGGDAALEEATFLTRFASEVTILVRRAEFKASKPLQARALKNSKIKVLWNTEVVELIGEEKLERVKIINNQTQKTSELEVEGYFASIGHKPNTEIFRAILELDHKGYIKHLPDSSKTNIEGVFACGDVIDPFYRQAITAAGTGCVAALDAERYLAAKE